MTGLESWATNLAYCPSSSSISDNAVPPDALDDYGWVLASVLYRHAWPGYGYPYGYGYTYRYGWGCRYGHYGYRHRGYRYGHYIERGKDPPSPPELRSPADRGSTIRDTLRERALERFAAPQDPIEMATFGETRIASEYCQIRVGGDVAALKGIMKLVLEAHDEALRNGAEPMFDLDFIAQHTHGFEASQTARPPSTVSINRPVGGGGVGPGVRHFLGGDAPFGYDVEPEYDADGKRKGARLVANPAQQAAIATMLSMHRDGKSLRAIAAEVQALGFRLSLMSIRRLAYSAAKSTEG
jgi:hypothetical protein